MPRIKGSMINFQRMINTIAEMAFRNLEIELFQESVVRQRVVNVFQTVES